MILGLTICYSTEHRGRPEIRGESWLWLTTRVVVVTLLVCYLEILRHRMSFLCMRLLKVRRALLSGALRLKWRVRHRLMQLAFRCPRDFWTDLPTRPCDRF